MEPPAEYEGHTDEELVRGLVLGDARSLEQISVRHARPAYSLALRMLGDPGWAEEVVQDVLLRLWRKPELFDPARGDLRKWLLTMTHHAAVDGLRGRRGTARSFDAGPDALDLLPVQDDDPADSAWRSLQAESVRRALASLPREQREVLELAYYLGLSQAEISRRTGQPLGTVKTRTRLALSKLRDSLRQAGVDG